MAGSAPEEWIPLRPSGFHAEHGVALVRGRATRLDIAARQLDVDGHASLPFDALLLSTGADPVRLAIPGSELPHVRYLRSLADSRAIIATASGARRAVVIGASFIGLEVAASLRARGLDVHVVGPEAVPLERVLGRELGAFVKALHGEKGVVFHLGRKPVRIEETAVVLDDGAALFPVESAHDAQETFYGRRMVAGPVGLHRRARFCEQALRAGDGEQRRLEQCERMNAIGVVEGELEGDRATAGVAGDVRSTDAKFVKQGSGIRSVVRDAHRRSRVRTTAPAALVVSDQAIPLKERLVR